MNRANLTLEELIRLMNNDPVLYQYMLLVNDKDETIFAFNVGSSDAITYFAPGMYEKYIKEKPELEDEHKYYVEYSSNIKPLEELLLALCKDYKIDPRSRAWGIMPREVDELVTKVKASFEAQLKEASNLQRTLEPYKFQKSE